MKRYVTNEKGKSLSTPISGLLSKFLPGCHNAEVTLVAPFDRYVNILFSLPDGSIHLESFQENPGLKPGQQVLLTVDHGPGYVVYRLAGGTLQARDAQSDAQLASAETPEKLLERLKGNRPSTPEIKGILYGGRELEFKLHSFETTKPKSEDPESPPWD